MTSCADAACPSSVHRYNAEVKSHVRRQREIVSRIAAVLLAAGEAARFGRPKQLIPWQGRPLILHTAGIPWSAGVDPVIVVLGAAAEQIAPLLEGQPLQVVRNYRWREGMGSSLCVGLAALPPRTEAVLFLTVDQPFVTPAHLRRLIAAWEAGASIAVTRWQGRRTVPALFDRRHFAQLAALQGDAGGRQLFDKATERPVEVEAGQPLLAADIDTPADYERLRARHPRPDLRGLRGVLCDMDGVLWHGLEPLPGLHDFFAFLRQHSLAFTLVTNNASKTPRQYVEKLRRFGIEIGEEAVLNSAIAAATYLHERRPNGGRVYPVGGPGVHAALREAGFTLVDEEAREADVVVVGWDPHLTWRKMARATLLIRNGAAFIGTNPDPTFPAEEGQVPGNGAQLAMLEAATGRKPTVVGKPETALYRQALARMGLRPQEVLVIGDRLDTDILGGVRLGAPTALLLSGVHGEEVLRRALVHPDFVFDDLAALVAAWEEALKGGQR